MDNSKGGGIIRRFRFARYLAAVVDIARMGILAAERSQVVKHAGGAIRCCWRPQRRDGSARTRFGSHDLAVVVNANGRKGCAEGQVDHRATGAVWRGGSPQKEVVGGITGRLRSEEHTSELQS